MIVTTAALSGAAQRLANIRESQGLRTAVIDVEAVMNEFNGGRSNPHALHDFLAYAQSFWNPAPRYVVFAGAGSLDYRNLLGNGDSLVPTILVSTSGGLFGSDNRVADLIGDDGIPDIAVGRIPATTIQQLNDYVDKLLAYEADPGGPWAGGVLALADARDQSADFAADSEGVLSQLSGNYAPIRIYLDNTALGAARSQLLGSVANGASFADYLGHGGLDRLSAGGLLSTGDVAGLHNGSRLPVLTAMTCEANRFTVPAFPRRALHPAGGGTAAVWLHRLFRSTRKRECWPKVLRRRERRTDAEVGRRDPASVAKLPGRRWKSVHVRHLRAARRSCSALRAAPPSPHGRRGARMHRVGSAGESWKWISRQDSGY